MSSTDPPDAIATPHVIDDAWFIIDRVGRYITCRGCKHYTTLTRNGAKEERFKQEHWACNQQAPVPDIDAEPPEPPSYGPETCARSAKTIPPLNALVEVNMVNDTSETVEWLRGYVTEVHSGGKVSRKNTQTVCAEPDFSQRTKKSYFTILYQNGEDYEHSITDKYNWRHVANNAGRRLHFYSSEVYDDGMDEYFEVVILKEINTGVRVHYTMMQGHSDDRNVTLDSLHDWNAVEPEARPPEGVVLDDMCS